ncbi:MAG: sodium-dependent transporter [Salinivirgaceae bacterium]|jgi:NSS family neurotransmitter:Na+ symporter|nr:sodium-dependent transporter [Salinivirgaceae bacterium]
MKTERDSFSSKFGVIAAAAGSAIGLGNIWKFPYIAGENGGGVFLIVYLVFILLIGIPVMMSEFIIGRKAHKNVFGAFRELTNSGFWKIIGVMGVMAAFFILSFYGTVAGWTMEFLILAITDSFSGRDAHEIEQLFSTFSEGAYKPVIFQIIFMAITALIVIGGIRKGIEKYTKILMPLLIVIILYLDITAVSLKGGGEGLRFLFNPDFSKLSPKLFIDALGHAFFTLSLGMGVLMTYASYFQKDTNLTSTSVSVAMADTIIALLAGIAIFPAVFAFSTEPAAGPGLVFITLPNIFELIPGGYVFSILFFLLLAVAALTSSISILEVVVAYLSEEKDISRTKATILAASAITVTGVLCTLSIGPLSDFLIFGFNIFELLDKVASNILLPLGGMLISIFVGWKMKRHIVIDELSNYGKVRIASIHLFMFLVRYLAPIAIFFVFLHGIGIIKI